MLFKRPSSLDRALKENTFQSFVPVTKVSTKFLKNLLISSLFRQSPPLFKSAQLTLVF